MKGFAAKALLVMLAVVSSTGVICPLTAAESRSAGLESREIKGLSNEQVEAYQAGRGLGAALAAELNGYPGPMHVLELAEQLALSGEQRDSTQAVFDEMRRSAIAVGRQIIERERELDELFSSRAVELVEVERRTLEIGVLQGELRAIHMRAHLQMTGILSADQVARYVELRVYRDHSAGEHGGRGEHPNRN